MGAGTYSNENGEGDKTGPPQVLSIPHPQREHEIDSRRGIRYDGSSLPLWAANPGGFA